MIRAIIVDPDETVRRDTVHALEHCGVPCAVVGEADRGQTARTLIAEKRPQLVISELELPDMSGIELLRQLRGTEVEGEFIFLCTRQDFVTVRAALRLGAADYLLKPLSQNELAEALQRVILRRSSPSNARLIVVQARQENRYVSEAIRYIAAHYSEPGLSVRSIARALDLSEGHLSRLFKEKTGYTMKNYLTLYRMGIAEDLLSDCRSRVYETAKQVGYQDVAYFSNTFKRVVGVSPTEYRNVRK
ncbi:MAG: response regulator [Oscillospiraceae bacterium]|nr:response regulator [Oscillospiraceae bacterium]